MTLCETIPIQNDGFRDWWGCPKCGRVSRTPTRSKPIFECKGGNGKAISTEELVLSIPRPKSPPVPPCSHLGRLHRSIPAGWLHCRCGVVRINECTFPDVVELTIERPLNADATDFLRQREKVVRCCAGCPDRNRRKTPPPDRIVLTDHGMGDVVLNCWFPQARLNVPANMTDVARMFGARPTDEPGEHLGPSWRPEMLAKEPRIDFRARWYGVTEIRRPEFTLDLEAMAWAKTLREPGRSLVVFVSQSQHNREREWPVDHWQTLGSVLSEWGCSIIMDLGKADAGLQRGPWRAFIRQPIPRLAAMLGEADLTISIDTGPAHMAGTMDRPVLLMLGPHLENSYEHMGSVQPIRSSRFCGGCNYLTTWGPQCHRECAAMRDLTPETVAARAMRMLTPTRIGVCSLATDEIADVRAVTRPNLEAYCERHGYPLHYATQKANGRAASWSKILILRDHLADHDWLWWADADLVVTGMTRRLEELTDGATGDLLISRDHNGINCGSFLLRNCPWSHNFLRRVWNTTDPHDHSWWEQWAIMRLLESSPGDRSHVQEIRKRSINSYPSDWRHGDFVLHAPGVQDRVQVLRKILDTATAP